MHNESDDDCAYVFGCHGHLTVQLNTGTVVDYAPEPNSGSREQLRELRDLCKRVLENPSLAAELLPTQSGFFFGATEYDSFYYDDCRYTYKRLTELLDASANESVDFEYQSSW